MALPTLASVKEWIGIASTADDELIQRCLDAAIQTVSEHVGTTIGSAQTDWHDINLGASRVKLIAGTHGEFRNVTALHLRAVNVDGAAVALSPDDGYTLLADNWRLTIRLTDALWEAFRAASPSGAAIDTLLPVQVSFTAGLAADSVPDDWSLCVLQLAAEAYQNRGDMPSRRRVSDVYLSRIAPRR